MSLNRVWLATIAICVVQVCVAGCAAVAIEGAKGAHVASAGDYTEIRGVAEGALAKYKGYKVGTLSIKIVTVPEDTKEKDRLKVQEHINKEMEIAKEVVALLPERFSEFMVDDAGIHLGVAPALVASVADVRVTKRKGAAGVLLPKAEIEALVTLTDARTNEFAPLSQRYAGPRALPILLRHIDHGL